MRDFDEYPHLQVETLQRKWARIQTEVSELCGLGKEGTNLSKYSDDLDEFSSTVVKMIENSRLSGEARTKTSELMKKWIDMKMRLFRHIKNALQS